MIGTAGLKGLRVECVVGIYAHERSQSQNVQFDLELDYDFTAAARSDAIGDAVNYEHVATAVTELVQLRKFQLLETMAEAVSSMILYQSQLGRHGPSYEAIALHPLAG